MRWLLKSPLNIIPILGALLKGRATLKQSLAHENLINAALLPYNKKIIEWIHHERASGRKLVLVTA
jgi:hypothetical protein